MLCQFLLYNKVSQLYVYIYPLPLGPPSFHPVILLIQVRSSPSTELSFLCFIVCPHQLFFLLTSLLEYNCFTMLCQFLLYNKVNQLYVHIYPHISSLLHLPPTLPIPPLQVVTKHEADLPVLCGCFPLAIYFTFGSVYMSMPLSYFIPAYPSPSLCPVFPVPVV